jgi:hypothetical protein
MLNTAERMQHHLARCAQAAEHVVCTGEEWEPLSFKIVHCYDPLGKVSYLV